MDERNVTRDSSSRLESWSRNAIINFIKVFERLEEMPRLAREPAVGWRMDYGEIISTSALKSGDSLPAEPKEVPVSALVEALIEKKK